jgi:hypothetical protein
MSIAAWQDDELLSTPEDRRQVYKMMSLRVLAHPDDTLIVEWGCNDASTPLGSCRTQGR